MSAIGPKQTSLVAPHMSAFEGKADMAKARSQVRSMSLGFPSLIAKRLRNRVLQNVARTVARTA